ncbi:TraB/GumN family protein [Maricurvus nonylphenolicus]|uniref:TraB/GumN family protein n=1 Tax=Maricurvus nonylphenolicus TaxID=1008307 RepID=UPI0036F19C3D
MNRGTGSFLGYWLIVASVVIVSSFTQADPLLWRVSDSANQRSVYLFGSIHFGQSSMYPLPDNVMSRYQDAESLVVEVDLLASQSDEMSALLSKYGHNNNGEKLSSLLEGDDWLRFQDICQRQGISAERFQHLQPWLAAIQLTAIQMRASGYSEAYGVDRYFLGLAKREDFLKPIVELESLQSQLSIFAGLSQQEQVLFLRQTLDEYESGGDYLRQIAEAWEQGDKVQLEKLIIGAFSDADAAQAMYEVIFAERNRRMLASVTELLKVGREAFVVVGVGHMIGQDGLVKQLRALGFQVEQL